MDGWEDGWIVGTTMVVESVGRWMVVWMEWEEVDGRESREWSILVFKNNLTE